MGNILLTIQSGNRVFSPPIQEGVQIDWERTGAAGKLTFKTIKVTNANMGFNEGDKVCFYYDDKPIFMGYVFKKQRDREGIISVTCYDQVRYLKNKYTYSFENKTATQIIKALCNDFELETGTMDNTAYVIPSLVEENTAALDISLTALEETIVNTGNMFVLYDDFGKITVKNCENMISTTLIYEESAENFDYATSIDDETYNSIILYYKDDEKGIQIFRAESQYHINQWGELRYFEEVKNPSIGQNKANSLLKIYNRKTRELKITGAFGDTTVRGGTLIPIKLNLGDIQTNNYMLVEKVTHKFDKDHYTMDLTLGGAWDE